MTRRAVTGTTLFDGTGGPPAPGSTIVWDEDRFTTVGPDGTVEDRKSVV